MLFVRQEFLKEGMRLAKPIYNKKGVLLYDRNSKLTRQGIESVHNFGLIGLYILEPAEPVPPMTEEDMEFERFSVVSTFTIQDELTAVHNGKKISALEGLTTQIVKRYGNLDHKINFVQSLRSVEDKYFKHSLNVAILCAMITHVLNIRLADQHDTVLAALMHYIGMLDIPDSILQKGENITDADRETISLCESRGFSYIEAATMQYPNVKRIAAQSYKALGDFNHGRELENEKKFHPGTRALMVANTFDTITAMNDYNEPSSEVSALRFLLEHENVFGKAEIEALTKSIFILAPGCSVELNTGEKALVLSENTRNVLKPVVLGFSSNQVIDLGQEVIFGNLYIKDVMKTLDNRVAIDHNALAGFGSMAGAAPAGEGS
ncbi:MAG: phosphohydrolase [Lachnospiraceae bacterium]|nr:phosphohydrolase [Lachnospiraceae bacterium]